MLQVTLGVYVPGSKHSICKDSDSIKLKFGILLQCGVFCGLGYPVRPLLVGAGGSVGAVAVSFCTSSGSSSPS